MGRRLLIAAVACAMLGLGFPLGPRPAEAVSVDIVISQVYGGGGNSGAVLKNDFIELFNLGAAAVNVNGWSVQYASTAGSSWQKTDLAGWIKPGRYYLVQEAQGAGGTVSLPTPHATGNIAMAAGAGKIVLLNTNTLTTTGTVCPSGAAVVDLVGYGTGSTCSETSPTATLSNATAAIRKSAGAQDTDNNNADFAVGTPTPRATADYQISVASTLPSGANVPLNTNIVITFSEPATVSGTWFTISCPASGSHTATVSGGPTSFTLDPDTDFAGNETCTVTVLAGLVTDQDSDDPPDQLAANFVFTFTTLSPPVKIREIQGAAHISPKNGQTVGGVSGIVTGRSSTGFWMQDGAPDADQATSEGIFVFIGSSPAVAVGDAVTVSGKAQEFRPGGASNSNLTTTEITTPTIVVDSHGNALPAAIVIGIDRTPPTSVIEDDAASGDVETSGTFDPTSDGLDFWESLEGMRVDLGSVVVVGPSNSFGEISVLANDGAGATGRSARGGIILSATDKNPERVIIKGVGVSMPSNLNVGDHFTTSVVGIVDYDFGNFMIQVFTPLTRVGGGLTRETTTAPLSGQLTAATFNVENLDPSDGSFANLAGLIVSNLRSPDLIALEEVQDNNGATNDGTVDATTTLTLLRDAIVAAGGPTYAWREIDPVNNQDGGEPGGNIRQVLFFRSDRGLAFIDRPGATSTLANSVVGPAGDPELQYSPGRIDPTNSAFNSSRKPLAAELSYDGHHLFVIANHFNSKGGDDALWGHHQPPILSSEVQRNHQATIVKDFVQALLAKDANAEILVVGDLNDFEFSNPVGILKAAPLHDLLEDLPANERYTYVFEGNSQTLDHILVSDSLHAASHTDVVHVNSEFWDQASDHEPQVATLVLPAATMLASRAPSANANGWNNTDVTVTFDCLTGDPLDIIVSCPADVVVTTEGAGQTVTRTASTKGGGTVTATVTGISIDKTPPVITFSGATTYTIDESVSVTCSITDALSGLVAGSICETASGPAYLLGVGTHTLNASGTDLAGNPSSASVSYTIGATEVTLCALTKSLVAKEGIAKSLCAKLDAAAASVARGDTMARANQLNAYRNEVEAQREKAMSDSNATALIELAGLL